MPREFGYDVLLYTYAKAMIIASKQKDFQVVDPIFFIKTGDRGKELRIDFGEIFELFAGPTDTWWPAIDFFF